ncbi:MAG: CAAX amino terminal protease self- immunity [Verrucomicrobia bacterium ADurb.Bin474]|nr:MAG: CAAX amino terminal protease self- immunity [Verrucomicrobia bacterium ADurb.Bin474]
MKPEGKVPAVGMIALYFVMAAVAAALMYWRIGGGASPWDQFTPGPTPLKAFVLTVSLVCAIHILSKVLIRVAPVFERSSLQMANVLKGLSCMHVGSLALASGIGEEMLFRGWLLNETGLWISSLLFGLMHIPPNRDWWSWPVFAGVVGCLLGLLYVESQSLIYPILAHAGINYVNICLILRMARRREGYTSNAGQTAPRDEGIHG